MVIKRILTTDVESCHDDHSEDTESLVPIVGANDRAESETSRILPLLASRHSQGGKVVVRVEVESFTYLIYQQMILDRLDGLNGWLTDEDENGPEQEPGL